MKRGLKIPLFTYEIKGSQAFFQKFGYKKRGAVANLGGSVLEKMLYPFTLF